VKTWTLRRPDVVHIATEGPLGWSALQAAKVLKLPVTSDFRTNFQSYSKHYGVGWLRKPIVAYLRKFHNATACTMVPTNELKRTLSENGFVNLKVVSRGVDTKLFNIGRRSTQLRHSWGADEHTKVLISVGRMAPEKNLEQVLRTYESLRLTDTQLKLVMVGDGPLREQFQQRHPNIIFPGMLSQTELAAYYASSDLFVFPSQTETFGNVTLEALASGIPVLAFDCAAARDWVQHGINGWLVPENNSDGFVDQAVAIFKTPNLLEQVTFSTRQQVVHLDWDQIAEQVESVFWDAIRMK
jgi:glycosyltransferase involved in cell wall biosynthesis